MPHMSPAAMGWIVVIALGWPEADETVTTAPSPMRAAAWSAVMIFGKAIKKAPAVARWGSPDAGADDRSQARLHLGLLAGLRRLQRRDADRHRPDAVLAGRRGLPLAGDRLVEGRDAARIEIVAVELQRRLALGGAQQNR